MINNWGDEKKLWLQESVQYEQERSECRGSESHVGDDSDVQSAHQQIIQLESVAILKTRCKSRPASIRTGLLYKSYIRMC
eukprot:scaffold76607_cov41-Attheya_sp.AAC.1